MTNQQKAYVYAIVTVLFWSTVATAFKLSLTYLDLFQLLLYASITSTILLGSLLIWQGKFREIFRYTYRQYIRSLIAGFLNPFLYYLILFKAYDLLPAQVAQPINYTWAITLTVLSVIVLKQRISATDAIAGLICYAGVVVISMQGDLTTLNNVEPSGVALALISTLIWASYWIYNIGDIRDPIAAMFLNFLFALPMVLICCLLFSSLTLDSVYALSGAVYVGIFEMGLAFVCWSLALKLADNTSKVSNLIFISPFLSLWFIHTLVGEEIYFTTYIGLVLIISGLLVQRLRIGGAASG
ncbi:MAG: DMT family transporter [Pseudomonadales bacterium]|nr:DMT family transporter [Pseudomonadales bacterium]MDP7596495.1 DMT family transporter [Pseudomonadales bacterium]HJN53324.1 DMT family transporter [Pseudomonadales bacterium]